MGGMTDAAAEILPGAEPFFFPGGPTGVLLVHGFTGSPQSLRPWGEYLAAAGLTVSCPLLPGHGTRWRDMADTTWPQWYGSAQDALADLGQSCRTTFVMGLSMGGTLTLLLAARHPEQVAGIVTVNASLGTDRRSATLAPLLARFVPSVAGVGSDVKAPGVTELAYDRTPLRAFASLRRLWATTGPELAAVTCPALAFRSRVDHVVEASSGRALLAGLTSTTVAEIVLENSYHVATLDNDKETIFGESLEFVRAHTPVSPVKDG
ncbi:MAG: alpha/beta hydrolase [Frankia sp.]